MKKSKGENSTLRSVIVKLELTEEEYIGFRVGQLRSKMAIPDYVKEILGKAGALKD